MDSDSNQHLVTRDVTTFSINGKEALSPNSLTLYLASLCFSKTNFVFFPICITNEPTDTNQC